MIIDVLHDDHDTKAIAVPVCNLACQANPSARFGTGKVFEDQRTRGFETIRNGGFIALCMAREVSRGIGKKMAHIILEVWRIRRLCACYPRFSCPGIQSQLTAFIIRLSCCEQPYVPAPIFDSALPNIPIWCSNSCPTRNGLHCPPRVIASDIGPFTKDYCSLLIPPEANVRRLLFLSPFIWLEKV
jgi:hypothetical protein